MLEKAGPGNIISPTPQLRILDGTSVSSDLDLVTELFHRIKRIIPESQKIAAAIQEHHFVDRACGGIRDAWVADDNGQAFGPRNQKWGPI